jgi:myo-inositol-1(or 4)-monophosphatase
MMPDRIAFMESLFREYERITLPAFGRIVAEGKSDGSSVTEADRAASAHVVAALKRHTPDHGIISEEESQSHLPDAEWQWAIDPLDGTAAFARGLPVWGIGIGLLYRGEPREGYLHFPVVRETYAFRNGAAMLNGQPVKAATLPVQADCRNVMITAIHGHVDVRRVRGLRLHNLGSNLYHMQALATARCEAIVTGPCHLWDLAPSLPFTRSIGHIERYLDGSPLVLSELLRPPDYGFPVSQPMLVGPPGEVDALLAMLRE